jgi:hypothetical protein
MLRRVALVRTDDSEKTYRVYDQIDKYRRVKNNVSNHSTLSDSCRPDDRGVTFLRNVGFHKSHAA